MNDEREISPYLWDRTPSRDPVEDAEFLRLEAHLGQYRRIARPPVQIKPTPRHWSKYLVLAASLTLVAVLSWWELRPKPAPIPTAWTRNGQQLNLKEEYKTNSEETVEVASIGRLRFQPGSRFRILESAQDEVMELLEGNFDALIIADPYRFRVVTAGARLDDLGCAYEVSVNKQGAGRVEVSLGWVRAHGAGADSFIAQGYESIFRPGQPPSEPRRVDANATNGEDVLVTLHQVWRGKSELERRRAFRTLAKQYPPPASVTEARAARGDRSLVKEWWPALPLGNPIAFPENF